MSNKSSSPEGKDKDKSAANLKLITTTHGVRVSQACDRCRIKKIKCDGLTPCKNCSKINFECKTSDKLTRRAFPKGYTENLEQKLKVLEEENKLLREKYGVAEPNVKVEETPMKEDRKVVSNATMTTNENNTVPINNPIDQIFNLDNKGIIIGNDNLNFESQFNHLLINLNLPFLKITNSHNFLLNDPNLYLYHPSHTMYNQFHNRDLEVIYNPLTVNNYKQHDDLLGNMSNLTNSQLPRDVYDLFIKLINNFKKIFNNKKELDNQIVHFFINYNTFLPIFDYKQFMESYDAFHTMYPFMFTYDDATINGFNILTNDYQVVNEYLMVVIQIYAMIMMNDPTINLNLLLNHPTPNYSFSKKIKNDPTKTNESIVRSIYDFLPYFNVFYVSVNQLQTYLLFLYYSLLTNNKEKSLVLSSMVNSFIGILGINLNLKNLFFNDLSLSLQQKRDRVKIFWVFKVLLKCFNLKFGFKPSLNTTVINPVTIERYFQLTPEKLSTMLESEPTPFATGGDVDDLFRTLLKPSVEFLNLMNIVIPSSFSPNYYQYLKNDRSNADTPVNPKKNKQIDWILNDDDGDGNDGNLNYNFTQFLVIDKNLTTWRNSLKDKELNLIPFQTQMHLSNFSSETKTDLYHSIGPDTTGINQEGLINYLNTGLPDIHTAGQLIKIQLNFHYLLIRSMNYLNFVIDRELTQNDYAKVSEISQEVLSYFLLVFEHVGNSVEVWDDKVAMAKSKLGNNVIMESLGLDVDDDGFVINDFSVKRRKLQNKDSSKKSRKQIPASPFNYMLNGLSMTIINFKKSIILQLLYLLVCSMRVIKKGGVLGAGITKLVVTSVDLFIKVFINYQAGIESGSTMIQLRKSKEDDLFRKLINDELQDELLKERKKEDESDDEFENSAIDWDDEEMDEDLKYLRVVKFVKYKMIVLQRKSNERRNLPQPSQVHHHHHVEEFGRHQSPPMHFYGPLPPPVPTPPPVTTPNFPGLSKIPSMNKLDFLLDESNFPNHTTSPVTFSYTGAGPSGTHIAMAAANKLKDVDGLAKKEKLVVNDLMSLKHSKGSYGKWHGSTASSPLAEHHH